MHETLDSLSPLMPHVTEPPSESLKQLPRPFLVLLALGSLLLVCTAWPVREPLFLAAVLTVSSRPLYRWLTTQLGGRPRSAGAVMTVLLLACIVVPVIALSASAIREITAALLWLRDSLGVDADQPASMAELFGRGLSRLAAFLHIEANELRGYVSDALHMVPAAAPYLFTSSIAAFGKTFLLVVSFYFFTVDGHWLTHFVSRVSPLRPAQTHELLVEFHNVSSGAVLGNAVNAVLQGLIVLVGFWFTGVPHPIFFGLLTMPAALIPLIGSQLVWSPAMVLLLLQGRVMSAVGLAVWCTCAVLVVDNLVKPWVLRGKVELHGGLLLLGFIGGLTMFGLPGLVAGPLAVAFSVTLFRIYQRDYLTRTIVTSEFARERTPN